MSTGAVGWFDGTKGCGFIRPGDRPRGAFLPAAVVAQAGRNPACVPCFDPKTRKHAASKPRAT